MTSIDNFFNQANPNNTLNPLDNPLNAKNVESVLQNAHADRTTDHKSEKPKNKHESHEPSDVSAFEVLGLSPIILKSIAKTGYTTPTPIQAQAIPPAIAGRDLLLSAQTGSGKTAAFVLPILEHLSKQKPVKTKTRQPKAVKALILTPTRELAHQVSDSIRRYGSAMKDLFSVPLVGGSAYSGQIRALRKGVQIIIATPGRLLDHINAGRVDLSELSILVLDEADRMLDMGFADDINAILDATPEHRQTIMSSATWDGAVGEIAESFTNNPERISIKVESAHIDEKVYFCDNFDHKNKLLEHLICDKDRQQAIIFTATKRSTEELAERLEEWGHKVCYLHGDLPQGKRNRIVADLRNGRYQLVVATDVAARGIDLPKISHVFNYDLPRQVEDYVHRIGRSGRAGRTGIAINLCSRDDRRQLGNINRYLKREMAEAVVEGLEPKFVEKEHRNKRGRSDRRGRGRDSFAGSRERFGNERFDRKSRFQRDDRPAERFAKGEKSENFERKQRHDQHDKTFDKTAKRFGERQFAEKDFDKKPRNFDKKLDKKFDKKFDKGADKPFKRERHEERSFDKFDKFEKKPRFAKGDDVNNFDRPKKSRKFGVDNQANVSDARHNDKRSNRNNRFDNKSDFAPRKKGVKEELYGASAPKHR